MKFLILAAVLILTAFDILSFFVRLRLVLLINRKMRMLNMCNQFLIFVIFKTDYTCYAPHFSVYLLCVLFFKYNYKFNLLILQEFNCFIFNLKRFSFRNYNKILPFQYLITHANSVFTYVITILALKIKY